MDMNEINAFFNKVQARICPKSLVFVATMLMTTPAMAVDYTKTNDVILDGDKAIGKVMQLTVTYMRPESPNRFLGFDKSGSKSWRIIFTEDKDREIVRKLEESATITVQCRLTKISVLLECDLLKFISVDKP